MGVNSVTSPSPWPMCSVSETSARISNAKSRAGDGVDGVRGVRGEQRTEHGQQGEQGDDAAGAERQPVA
jgi:hypothetical protein